MHRTNLYLTVEQEKLLDSRARRAGISRSALVRNIIDAALAAPDPADGTLDDAFVRLADGYEAVTLGMFEADPDLCVDR
jgi:hypothetical protein